MKRLNQLGNSAAKNAVTAYIILTFHCSLRLVSEKSTKLAFIKKKHP